MWRRSKHCHLGSELWSSWSIGPAWAVLSAHRTHLVPPRPPSKSACSILSILSADLIGLVQSRPSSAPAPASNAPTNLTNLMQATKRILPCMMAVLCALLFACLPVCMLPDKGLVWSASPTLAPCPVQGRRHNDKQNALPSRSEPGRLRPLSVFFFFFFFSPRPFPPVSLSRLISLLFSIALSFHIPYSVPRLHSSCSLSLSVWSCPGIHSSLLLYLHSLPSALPFVSHLPIPLVCYNEPFFFVLNGKKRAAHTVRVSIHSLRATNPRTQRRQSVRAFRRRQPFSTPWIHFHLKVIRLPLLTWPI